ncbi:MAG: hypothetical protein Q4G25_00955 [Paracoccus sp. (in: a-proteobacteria)]|nr:hypothetical protein [Paracoccus sp. (in: a-proteobacteria)]
MWYLSLTLYAVLIASAPLVSTGPAAPTRPDALDRADLLAETDCGGVAARHPAHFARGLGRIACHHADAEKGQGQT